MGKYMKKAKTAGDVAVMDLSLGVRTRAKTLALQRQAHLQPPSATGVVSGGYIQLRSRRLEKLPIILRDSKRQRCTHNNHRENPNPNPDPSPKDVASRVRTSSDSESLGSGHEEEVGVSNKGEQILEDDKRIGNSSRESESKDFGVEASFGENFLEIDGTERSTRESTPCSLIRDSETIRTPGSTTRPSSSTDANGRIQNSAHEHIPTAHEMNDFFSGAEEEQRKQFIEKYNFDPVKDKPLPGRFEWEKLDP
ncbi:hypothetical protein K2173_009574 [Erythroxylum novogranatense]|uniref:Cyclin-dependent kinase inhibitor domain-containing protein n=1 Tax=Erythroxylum novogranatense TaxID=1862640 RepID=A0AAV8U729_9ROSI|nr:hypothetical protein K2173_009574 [Erythroxylum novogranatense]